MIRRAPLLLIAVLLVVSACGDDNSTANTARAATPSGAITSPEYLAFGEQPVACGADAPSPAIEMAFSEPDQLDLDAIVTAVIHTSCGPITIELDPLLAPVTVNSFVYLAESGYFDGTVSHRVAPGFVIQAGDPTATGRGGPGYLLPDEPPPTSFVYARGIVAMANAGANTGGSQFFLMLADNALPPLYSVFGRVVDGFEAMDLIASVPLTSRGPNPEVSSPLETIYIERVDIQR